MIVKTFKTRIYPTKNQREYFHKAFGIRRWVWNWGLENYFNSLSIKKKSNFDLQKELNHEIVPKKEYKWLSEVNSMVRQESFKDLSISLSRYNKELNKAMKLKANNPSITFNTNKFKPKFKSKKRDINSFRLMNKGNPLKVVSGHYFNLTTTRKQGCIKIKTAEKLGFLKDVTFCTITISENAGKYYASITYKRDNYKKRRAGKEKVGIDMGIHTPMTCMFEDINGNRNSEKFELPKDFLKKEEKKRGHIQKLLSRKQYGSNNYNKIKRRLQKAFIHEANIKKDFREKKTTELVKRCSVINIETFSHVSGLNFNNGRALNRVCAYTMVERLKEKCIEYRVQLNFIPVGTPTTQTCSVCGYVHSTKAGDKIMLSQRSFTCKKCNTYHDRDVNAATNILNYQPKR